MRNITLLTIKKNVIPFSMNDKRGIISLNPLPFDKTSFTGWNLTKTEILTEKIRQEVINIAKKEELTPKNIKNLLNRYIPENKIKVIDDKQINRMQGLTEAKDDMATIKLGFSNSDQSDINQKANLGNLTIHELVHAISETKDTDFKATNKLLSSLNESVQKKLIDAVDKFDNNVRLYTNDNPQLENFSNDEILLYATKKDSTSLIKGFEEQYKNIKKSFDIGEKKEEEEKILLLLLLKKYKQEEIANKQGLKTLKEILGLSLDDKWAMDAKPIYYKRLQEFFEKKMETLAPQSNN